MIMNSESQLLSDSASVSNSFSSGLGEDVLPCVTTRYPFDFGDLIVEYPLGNIEPSWFFPVAESIQKIARLRVNWDSHGARIVSHYTLMQTLTFLFESLSPNAPTPAIVPLASGDVQLEWHQQGIDFEVEIAETGPVGFYFADSNAGIEHEEAKLNDRACLENFVSRLVSVGQL